jgi:hypothetical protein
VRERADQLPVTALLSRWAKFRASSTRPADDKDDTERRVTNALASSRKTSSGAHRTTPNESSDLRAGGSSKAAVSPLVKLQEHLKILEATCVT